MRFLGNSVGMNGGDDTFTFVNSGIIPVRLAFLGSSWVGSIPPSPDNPLPVESTYVPDPSDFSDYTQLVNDKDVNPKKIKHIRMISDNFNQFSNPMTWTFKDANGMSFEVVDQPLNMLSPMQFQSRLIDMNYDNLVVGEGEYFVWVLLPGTTVTITFTYDDYKLDNLLLESRRNLIKS